MSKPNSFSLSFGALTLPMDITSIVQGEAGQSRIGGRSSFSFRFQYRSITFMVRCANDGEKASAHLVATLGSLPFSGESIQARQYMRQLHRLAVAELGPIITLTGGRFKLEADIPLATPLTSVGLLTEITRFLLPLKPYIELMAMVRMMCQTVATISPSSDT